MSNTQVMARPGEDLQQGVVQQVTGLTTAGEDATSELLLSGVDAVPVSVGGRAAHVFASGEALFAVGKLLEAEEPVLVGVVVGEPRSVGTAVSKSNSDMQVSILDGTGDQPSGPADDVPGQGPAK